MIKLPGDEVSGLVRAACQYKLYESLLILISRFQLLRNATPLLAKLQKYILYLVLLFTIVMHGHDKLISLW